MTPSIDDLWGALERLEMAARHVLKAPLSGRGRSELRLACDHAAALRQGEAAARKALDTLPGPRGEPEDPREHSDEPPEPDDRMRTSPPTAEEEHAWQRRKDAGIE